MFDFPCLVCLCVFSTRFIFMSSAPFLSLIPSSLLFSYPSSSSFFSSPPLPSSYLLSSLLFFPLTCLLALSSLLFSPSCLLSHFPFLSSYILSFLPLFPSYFPLFTSLPFYFSLITSLRSYFPLFTFLPSYFLSLPILSPRLPSLLTYPFSSLTYLPPLRLPCHLPPGPPPPFLAAHCNRIYN